MTDGYLQEAASVRELSRIPGTMSEELKQRIERRKAIDADKVLVRVDESTWLLLPLKHKNRRYINNWRKLANRDRYRLAEKFDELYGGMDIDD